MHYPRQKPRADVVKILKKLRLQTKGMPQPASAQVVARYGKDPYLILISCLLSLRARDTASLPASIRLFEHARTAQDMVKLPIGTIEKIIHSVGFFRQKARSVKEVSQALLDRFKGKVPKTWDELTSIKGIGPKTANLVLAEAYGVPAICVDTHVHRLSQPAHLGLLPHPTKSPEATEAELKKIVPKAYWRELNHLLVMWGQNVCKPGRKCKCGEITAH